MNEQIESSWKKVLANEFSTSYFLLLTKAVGSTYLKQTVFPPQQLLFNAFTQCPFNRIKVVILGQDPYHGEGQAHGLAFSVPNGVVIPPSLRNIFKEINSDVGPTVFTSGNLENWAKQGVLLLNSTLTVESGKAGSHHALGWEQFTDAVIAKISVKKEHVVFLLWGAYAQNKRVLIDETKHLVLTAPHPSPLSAYRGFLGCQHFSQTNSYLINHGYTPIIW